MAAPEGTGNNSWQAGAVEMPQQGIIDEGLALHLDIGINSHILKSDSPN
jgi:hypothetical protein